RLRGREREDAVAIGHGSRLRDAGEITGADENGSPGDRRVIRFLDAVAVVIGEDVADDVAEEIDRGGDTEIAPADGLRGSDGDGVAGVVRRVSLRDPANGLEAHSV